MQNGYLFIYLLPSHSAEGYVLMSVYLFVNMSLFVCLFVCYSHNSKGIAPNHIKFGGMIGQYPRNI